MTSSRPTKAQLVEQYNEFYCENPKRWDDFSRNEYAWKVIDYFLRGTNREKPRAMLDIGCGSGHTILFFTKRWPSTIFYGLDLSEVAIAFAKKRISNAHFLVGALGEIKIESRFDIITLLGVLEHFEKPVSALVNVKNLLSPRGLVYVEVPNCLSYPESERTEGFRQLNCGSRQWEWHLMRQSWKRLIEESGFAIALSLKGPKPSTEFIWVLTLKPNNIAWKYKIKILTLEKRFIALSRYEICRGNIMKGVRQIIGNAPVDRAKKLLGIGE